MIKKLTRVLDRTRQYVDVATEALKANSSPRPQPSDDQVIELTERIDQLEKITKQLSISIVMLASEMREFYADYVKSKILDGDDFDAMELVDEDDTTLN